MTGLPWIINNNMAIGNLSCRFLPIIGVPPRINERLVIWIAACVNDTMKTEEGGRLGPENIHNNTSSCVAGVSNRHPWDQSLQSGLKSIQPPSQSPPSRLSGGNGYGGQCTCASTNKSSCGGSSSRAVEACVPGLHEKYKDFYRDCREIHQAQPYRRAVDHDDLYLPASRPLSPVSIDHDDLYLPLAPSCPPVPTKSCSCKTPPSRSDCFGDIYLPPSRPCTPRFCDDKEDIYLPPSPKCAPPPRECFGLGGMASKFDDMPRPASSCKPSPNPNCCYPDLKLPPSRPLTPMSVEPIDLYLPPSPTCSQSYSPSPSCSPSRCPSPSLVYIDEHPAPPCGERYVSCKDCLCHKAESTRNLCPTPQTSPCRDCVCHLGSWSPSQRGGAGPPSSLGGSTRCGDGFKTPSKPRAPKPSFSCSMPSRPPSPPSNPAKSSYGGADPRCQSCDCHKKGNSPSRCAVSKPSSPCSMPPRQQCPEPRPSYCFTPSPSPCRLPFAAELLPANGICYGNPQKIPSPSPCRSPPPSCPPLKPNPCDPRCATCDCHKPNCPPSPPPCGCSPPPTPKSPSCGPCGSGGGGGGPQKPKFKIPSPRCAECDCHKNSKQMKCSMQVTATNMCPLGCLCRHCQTRFPPVDRAGPSNATNMVQQPKPDQRCMQTQTVIAPRERYPSCIQQGMGTKVEFPLTCNSESRDLVAYSPQRIAASGSQDRVLTQGCCCGTCDSIESRSLITSQCAFCEHMHSCCCGMCACPNPSCGSKSPISDPCTCMFRYPKSGSGILRDRPRSSNSILMSWKAPGNVVSSNNSLPGKGAMCSKSPNFSTKLRFLEPKVRYAGPECTSLYPPIITSSSLIGEQRRWQQESQLQDCKHTSM